MSFIEQAAKVFSGMAEFKFQAVLFGREALYIEGVRAMRIDGAEMVFRAARAVITVKGSDMAVKDMEGDCIAVVGKINGFTVDEL